MSGYVGINRPISPIGKIDSIADVDTTTTAPTIGDRLEWDGSDWVPVAGLASTSTESASFSVAVVDGFDHYYYIDTASIVSTIPTGLTIGHRFVIDCKSDSTFVTTGLTVNLPAGKSLAPFDDGAIIGVIVVATDVISVHGDLENVLG